MSTPYVVRVTILIPDARKAAVTSWWVANLDPHGATTFSNGLSASGNPPYTHWWACTALTLDQFGTLIQRICQMAGTPFPPTGWGGWTRREKRDWVESQIDGFRAATGIRIRVGDNDGDWNLPQRVREDEGLKVEAS